MQSAWSDADAHAAIAEYTAGDPSRCNEDLALRVYTSRLIGREPALVLHGGGNTSVKTTLPDDLGEPTAVACIKGSGWDLATIAPAGLPAVRLAPLQALRRLSALSDEAMVNAVRVRMLDASAPNPSVEALLHVFLPHKFIDHSHADAVLAVVDQRDAEALAREVFGPAFAVVPYIMPGFALAQRAAEAFAADPDCHGLVLLQHGLFTFGATARESYERHIAAVTRAEQFIAGRRRARVAFGGAPLDWAALAPALRGALASGGRRSVLHLRQGPEVMSFVQDERLADLAGRGPITPDHVIRTKQRPLVLDLAGVAPEQLRARVDRAVADYRAAYASYFEAQCAAKGVRRTMLDPDPRVILVPGLGLVTAGADLAAAEISADLYEHTIAVIRDAEDVGRYQALPDGDIFDMEYWSLEQAKLGKAQVRPLQGQVVYVTGAASGIGLATARKLRAAGAQLFLVDRDDERLAAVAKELAAAHACVDVCDRAAVQASVDAAVRRFGGLDGVVSNAGAAVQAPIAACPEELLRASLELNLLAHQWVASAAADVLQRQGTGGFLLFNASKAAVAPGENFGPYAVAKAALVALMRQYALELGRHGVRANAVNADRVRTGLFSPEVVRARAEARGLDPGQYFRANLLAREVTADDVAQAFLDLALAPSTTGAVVPVDGGNLAAAPRYSPRMPFDRANRPAPQGAQMPANFRPIADLDDGWADPRPGLRLADLRARGEAFAPRFKADGAVRAVRTLDLLPFPYPVAFGFWQAPPNRAKYLLMRNRCVLVEFEDWSGAVRTILVNPTEADLSAKAGFFDQMRRDVAPFVPRELLRRVDGPAALLRTRLGVDPAKIDYVAFDHLHVQDLRRGLIGEGGRPPLYPNARLIVNRRELETLQDLHPLQRPWWIEEALDGVPPEKLIVLEGSAWLGKGLALVWTPGHTLGNTSIVLHAPGRGVFAISENGICPESYLPRASGLRSLREHAAKYDAEVVLNGNALESSMSQYTSMVLEKALVDRGDAGGEVPNIYCSSPLVRSPLAWGIGPRYTIAPINTGALQHSLA